MKLSQNAMFHLKMDHFTGFLLKISDQVRHQNWLFELVVSIS